MQPAAHRQSPHSGRLAAAVLLLLVSAVPADAQVNIEALTKSNPAGVTTSNGLRLDIAPTIPQPQMTSIRSLAVPKQSPFPTTGLVRIGRGPVMRLETR